MELKERIKFIRTQKKLTQQDFADKIGIKRNSLANYEIGRNTPIDAIFVSICREFDVNEEWLRTGAGDPFIEKDNDDLLAAWVSRVLEGRDESIQKRTLNMLRQLDAADWACIDALVAKGMQLLADQNKED